MSNDFLTVEIKPTQIRKVREKFSKTKRDAYERAIANGTAAAGATLYQHIRENIVQQGLVATGQYLASWQVSVNPQTGGTTVRSNHPAAYRLEYGFSGIDASGRMYHQPPRPHVRPAMGQAKAEHIKAVRQAIETEARK
jgi:hypothetical protein